MSELQHQQRRVHYARQALERLALVPDSEIAVRVVFEMLTDALNEIAELQGNDDGSSF